MIAPLFRRLGFINPPNISRNEAYRLAQNEALRLGWEWNGDIAVVEGFMKWKVLTNCHAARGGFLEIYVSNRDGMIISSKRIGDNQQEKINKE